MTAKRTYNRLGAPVLVHDSDSLACTYPDCARYIDHHGPHEFPWGGTIPWPPDADYND